MSGPSFFNGGRVSALTVIALCTAFPVGAMSVRPRIRLDMENTAQGELRFNAQTAVFKGNDPRQRLEISYSFRSDKLQFLGDSGSHPAGYSFSVIVSDRKGRQVAGDIAERTLLLGDKDTAQRLGTYVSGTMSFSLSPGSYRVKMVCSDANSQRTAALEKDVTLPELNGACVLSALRFERVAGADTVPWPMRRYGDVVAPLIAYCEAYDREPGDRTLSVRLWSLDEEKTAWESRRTRTTAARTPVRIVIPADSIVSGNYELQVALLASGGDTLSRASGTVIIDNARLLTDRDYQYKVDQLRYIAHTHELDSLKRAVDGQRDSLWERFWRTRDPTPGTDKNEAMDEYYERVGYANQHFTIGIKPGWRSDMGQIYIRYGAPDEIEHHPFDPEVAAFEVWYYYSSGRKYVFSDVQGFGEFRLIYPTNERMQ